jgi:hypothetical protein
MTCSVFLGQIWLHFSVAEICPAVGGIMNQHFIKRLNHCNGFVKVDSQFVPYMAQGEL